VAGKAKAGIPLVDEMQGVQVNAGCAVKLCYPSNKCCFVCCIEFRDLFPDRDLTQLTAITLSQRTQNDMTSWSEDVERERENLLQSVSVIRSESMCE